MKEVSSEVIQETEEAALILDEYKQRLTQVIGREKESVRKQAEEESATIVARATQEAQEEVGRIIAEAENEVERVAEKITREARGEAERLTRAVSELKQQAEHDIEEVKEKVWQTAASVIEATRRAEKTIDEARNKVERDLEESAGVIADMNQNLEQIINAADHESEPEPKNQGEPVASTAVITEEGTEVTGLIVPVKGGCVFQEVGGDKLYQGTLELEILPPVDSVHLGELLKQLRAVSGLQLLLVGDTAGKKTRITVFAGKLLPLLSILKEMPPVASVTEQESSIQVVLSASADK